MSLCTDNIFAYTHKGMHVYTYTHFEHNKYAFPYISCEYA